MSKCYAKHYERFLPKDFTANFTAEQIRKISDMPSTTVSKMIGALAKAGDKNAIDVLSTIVSASPEKLQQLTRKGSTLSKLEREAVEEAEKIKRELSPEQLDDGTRAANIIASTYSKGRVLTEGEREILYPHFSKLSLELPSVMEQLEFAISEGNDQLASYLGNKLMRFYSVASAIAGDKNAVSISLNSMKRLNQEIGGAGQITRLFDNGAC